MDKKDIYEHLAKIYLDASLKKEKPHKKFIKHPAIIGLLPVLVAAIFFLIAQKAKMPFSEYALILQHDTVKINFNFDPAKKEVYSTDLKKLDLNKFEALGFTVRRANYHDVISLRVEFTDSFKEKSEIYLKDIPYRWKDFKVPFASFKNISDWSEMLNLSFIVEEWNTKEKNSVVYIDNIRFLR